MPAPLDDSSLLEAARSGDRAAFDRLAAPLRPALRAFIYRMVTQPEDADDLVQDTLLRAYRGLSAFRGESAFRTWLFTIAHRLCIDHLKTRRRWPWTAQLAAEKYAKSIDAELAPIHGSMTLPGFRYEVREHIAFCCACVGRSLPPEQHAAILLSEMFDFRDREGAAILGVSEPTFRHRLQAARQQMEKTFDGLCALVSKQGACYQCDVLREAAPVERRGEPVRPIGSDEDSPALRLRKRFAIARQADLDTGDSRLLHDVILRLMSRMFNGDGDGHAAARGDDSLDGAGG